MVIIKIQDALNLRNALLTRVDVLGSLKKT